MLIHSREYAFPSGDNVTIKSPTAEDAQSLYIHRLITSQETDFMASYPEELDSDMDSVRASLTAMADSSRSYNVAAFIGDRIIGNLGVAQVRDSLKYRHRAYMGISIQKRYCNLGLGSIMVEIALDQAREIGYEQMELGAFADNERAIHLYEKFGFRHYGIQPRAFKLKDGSYHDEVIMVKML